MLGVWLAGVAALTLYHLGGWRLARRLPRQGRCVSESVETLARNLCRRLGIGRAVVLLESSAVTVPMVMGWLKPVVLVPASTLTGLSPRQLEAILAHELAHVRRHDYLVNLFQTAVETLLFYQPAVWWVSAQVRRERENCCDDLAVAVCGDRLGYARALADLEGLRAAGPRLAMAADGGSLSDRIRRVVGVPGRSSRRSWAAGLLALALLPVGAAVQLACHRDAAAEKRVQAMPVRAGEGRWTLVRQGEKLRLQVTMGRVFWNRWELVSDYDPSDFTGLATGSGLRFEMRRGPGAFRFRGNFDGQRGQGTMVFVADPVFAKEMGFDAQRDRQRLMELASHDITLDYVRQMAAAGLWPPPARRPPQYGGTPKFVSALTGLGYRDLSVDQLIQLRIHGVTPALVRGLAEAGLEPASVDELVMLQIHGIDVDFAKGLRDAGLRHLTPDQLVQLKIHGIAPEYVRGVVQAGYPKVLPGQLVDLYLHDVNGDFIRKAQSEGHRGLSPRELIDLRVQGKVSN